MGPSTPKVPLRPIHSLRPNVRITNAIEEASAFLLGRIMHDSKRVKLANFQKWVSKLNGLGDPYDHLASFKQVVRTKQVNNLHTKVEGFELSLEA